MQVTARDERMFDWLTTVRLASTDAVRWALAAFDGRSEPVTMRRAQQWIARGMAAGVIERGRPVFQDGAIIWPSRQVSGQTAPSLYRATTRHDVAVSSVSARYLAAGYTWSLDRAPRGRGEHRADGVAERDGRVELVEVELTAKTLARYQVILAAHARRLTEDAARIAYLGTPDAMRVVGREADARMHPALRPQLVTLAGLDERGHIIGDLTSLWPRDEVAAEIITPAEEAPAPEAPAAEPLPTFGWED